MRRAAVLGAALAMVAALAAPTAAHAAAPTISYSLSGTPGANGWYRSAVVLTWTVNFNGRLPLSSFGCEAAIRLTADTRGTTRTCSAQNVDGTTSVTTAPIKIDKTPPVVTRVAPARRPDSGTWYRAPVAVAWSGTDATSGVASCSAPTYAGPDGRATLTGSCRDNAGNVSTVVPFALDYDATPPGLAAVTAAGGDTVATVRWQAAADAVSVVVARSPGAGGAPATVVHAGGPGEGRFEDVNLRNRARYRYTVTARDAAGNLTSVSADAQTGSWLRGPRAGARLTAPPLLRWTRVRGARYYNVQLFRGTRKVLSTWPTRPALRLHRTWRYGGRRHRLTPGLYRWFVWPGYGRRAQERYGRLLGTRRFVIARRAAR